MIPAGAKGYEREVRKSAAQMEEAGEGVDIPRPIGADRCQTRQSRADSVNLTAGS